MSAKLPGLAPWHAVPEQERTDASNRERVAAILRVPKVRHYIVIGEVGDEGTHVMYCHGDQHDVGRLLRLAAEWVDGEGPSLPPS